METTVLCRVRSAAFLLAAAVVLSAPSAARGGDYPLGLCINSDGGARFPGPSDSVYGFRLGVFQAESAHMFGIAASGFVNTDNNRYSGEVAGLQIAGIGNGATFSQWGVWQIAALINNLKRTSRGVQISGVNFMEGGGEGLQCGVWNEADDDFWGVQVGAFANTVKGNLRGIQIGCINDCEKEVRGAQIGVFNLAVKGLSGIQIGVVNRVGAGYLHGVQLGLINVYDGPSESFEGIQLGGFGSGDKVSGPVAPLLRVSF